VWEYVYRGFNLKGWLSFCVFVSLAPPLSSFLFCFPSHPIPVLFLGYVIARTHNHSSRRPPPLTTKRNHYNIIGQGVVKVFHDSMIVNSMNNSIRVINLLCAMGVTSSLRGWMHSIGTMSVLSPPVVRFKLKPTLPLLLFSEIRRRCGMCPFTRSQWGGMHVRRHLPQVRVRVCLLHRELGLGVVWEQDSVVFNWNWDQEVQWGLG